jgi:hypothetical protein
MICIWKYDYVYFLTHTRKFCLTLTTALTRTTTIVRQLLLLIFRFQRIPLELTHTFRSLFRVILQQFFLYLPRTRVPPDL